MAKRLVTRILPAHGPEACKSKEKAVVHGDFLMSPVSADASGAEFKPKAASFRPKEVLTLISEICHVRSGKGPW